MQKNNEISLLDRIIRTETTRDYIKILYDRKTKIRQKITSLDDTFQMDTIAFFDRQKSKVAKFEKNTSTQPTRITIGIEEPQCEPKIYKVHLNKLSVEYLFFEELWRITNVVHGKAQHRIYLNLAGYNNVTDNMVMPENTEGVVEFFGISRIDKGVMLKLLDVNNNKTDVVNGFGGYYDPISNCTIESIKLDALNIHIELISPMQTSKNIYINFTGSFRRYTFVQHLDKFNIFDRLSVRNEFLGMLNEYSEARYKANVLDKLIHERITEIEQYPEEDRDVLLKEYLRSGGELNVQPNLTGTTQPTSELPTITICNLHKIKGEYYVDVVGNLPREFELTTSSHGKIPLGLFSVTKESLAIISRVVRMQVFKENL